MNFLTECSVFSMLCTVCLGFLNVERYTMTFRNVNLLSISRYLCRFILSYYINATVDVIYNKNICFGLQPTETFDFITWPGYAKSL